MDGKFITKVTLVAAATAVAGGLLFSQGVSAAGTATWTGGGSDKKFSTVANWKDGVAPKSGDKLILPCASEELTLNNDLSDVKFSGVEEIQGKVLDNCKDIKIDKMDFTDDITLTAKPYEGYNSGGLISSPLSITNATGATNSVSFRNNNDYSSLINVKELTLTTKKLVLGGGSNIPGNITPTESVDFIYAYTNLLDQFDKFKVKKIISGNLDLMGDKYSGDLTFKKDARINAGVQTKYNPATKELDVVETKNELSGKLTLLGDVEYYVREGASLKLTGSIDGENFAIKANSQSWGDFENATKSDNSKTLKGKQEFKAEEVDLKKLCKTVDLYGGTGGFTIGRNQYGVLADDSGCKYGNVVIDGLLKGVGTINHLTVNGTLAPGNSPGTITVTQSLTFGTNLSVFDVEILNKDSYDKVIVGKDYDATYGGNAVSITTGTTLKLTYLPNGSFKKGDVLTIIDNQSNTEVKGEFKDMPEGAEVRVGNATFKISYKGGDGNDVTLTAQNDSVAPKTPNTGNEKLAANPIVAVVASVAAAGALLIARRKSARR